MGSIYMESFHAKEMLLSLDDKEARQCPHQGASGRVLEPPVRMNLVLISPE